MFTQNLYMNVHRRFIHISQKLRGKKKETHQDFLQWVYPHQRIPRTIRNTKQEKRTTDTCNDMDESPRNYAK